MTLIKKDLELFGNRFLGIKEDIHDDNYLAATKKIENGKQILQDKIDNSDKAAHPFLKKQMQMLNVKQNKVNDQYNTINLKKQAIANQVQATIDAQVQQQQQQAADAEAMQQQGAQEPAPQDAQVQDPNMAAMPQQDPNAVAQSMPQDQQPMPQQNPAMQQPLPPQDQQQVVQPDPNITIQQDPNNVPIQQPEEPQSPVYDPNDPVHADLIKQYHHQKMAEVRAAKTTKQPEAPVYDPNDPTHASIIQQYHQHKMAHARAHKEIQQQDQQSMIQPENQPNIDPNQQYAQA